MKEAKQATKTLQAASFPLSVILAFTVLLFFRGRLPDPPILGSFSVVQNCTNSGFSGDVNCVLAATTTNNEIVVFGSGFQTGANTISFVTTSCTGTTLTLDTQSNFTPASTTYVANQAWGKVTTGGSCTVTLHASAAWSDPQMAVLEISGTNNTVDAHSLISLGSQGGGSGSCSCAGANITTAVNGDFIVSNWVNASANGGTYTAGSGTLRVNSGNFGIAMMTQTQTSAGSITPSMASLANSGNYMAGSVALEASGGAVAAPGMPKILKLERMMASR